MFRARSTCDRALTCNAKIRRGEHVLGWSLAAGWMDVVMPRRNASDAAAATAAPARAAAVSAEPLASGPPWPGRRRVR